MTYLDALQDTLAAEHAAVYVLGYLGAQTSESTQPALYAALGESYATHRARRDQLVSRVLDEDADPVAALAAYELDDVAQAPAAITARALLLEEDCAATYGYLVASSPSDRRRYAVDLLADAALRSLTFGGTPQDFPGR